MTQWTQSVYESVKKEVTQNAQLRAAIAKGARKVSEGRERLEGERRHRAALVNDKSATALTAAGSTYTKHLSTIRKVDEQITIEEDLIATLESEILPPLRRDLAAGEERVRRVLRAAATARRDEIDGDMASRLENSVQPLGDFRREYLRLCSDCGVSPLGNQNRLVPQRYVRRLREIIQRGLFRFLEDLERRAGQKQQQAEKADPAGRVLTLVPVYDPRKPRASKAVTWKRANDLLESPLVQETIASEPARTFYRLSHRGRDQLAVEFDGGTFCKVAGTLPSGWNESLPAWEEPNEETVLRFRRRQRDSAERAPTRPPTVPAPAMPVLSRAERDALALARGCPSEPEYQVAAENLSDAVAETEFSPDPDRAGEPGPTPADEPARPDAQNDAVKGEVLDGVAE